MAQGTSRNVVEAELQRLEKKLDELANTCERLKEDNRALRMQQKSLSDERATLIESNDMARMRVEAIITRLKAMEHS